MSIDGLVLLAMPPAAGVALGYLLGGRLSGFSTVRLVALWLLWLAAAVQASQYYLRDVRDVVERRLGVPMLAIVFALVFVWFAINIPRWPRAIRIASVAIVLGAALNAVVIAVNGRMPYEPAMAAAVGLQPGLTTPKNEPADARTRLSVFGDTIAIPPLHKVISLGDVLISSGAAALVVLAMRRRHDPPRTVRGGET